MKHLTITLFAALMAFAAMADTAGKTQAELDQEYAELVANSPPGAFLPYPKFAEPPPARELGAIDRWRYERCIGNAAQAPTPVGVLTGRKSCNRQFGQN